MGIASRPACDDPYKLTEPQAVVPKCYKTITCNNRTGLPDLSDMPGGAKMTVDYVQQILDRDDSSHHLDQNLSPVHQQYLYIQDLEMDIIDELSNSIDAETNIVTITGSSRISSFVKPNVGDLILAVLQNDVRYYLKVTSVQGVTYSRGTKYIIEYQLADEVITTDAEYLTLLDKIDEIVVYDPGLAASGQNPMLEPEDAQVRADINPYMASISKDWFKAFVDRDTGYLMLTRNGQGVYDPHVTNFVTTLLGTGCAVTDQDVRKIPINKANRKKYSLYDIFIDRSLSLTSSVCRQFCQTPHADFKGYRDASAIFTTNVGYVVGKNDTSYNTPQTNLSNSSNLKPACPDRYAYEGNTASNDCAELDPPCCWCNESDQTDVATNYGRTTEHGADTIPIIKDPLIDNTYVFSQAYYDGDAENMSYLERIMTKYVKNEPVTADDLMVLFDDVKNWCSHSLYYYSPMLLLLGKYVQSTKCVG